MDRLTEVSAEEEGEMKEQKELEEVKQTISEIKQTPSPPQRSASQDAVPIKLP